MKNVFVLLSLMLNSVSVAKADPPAIHGMLVLGEDQIFLSHLPMFHKPHDYQAIFQVMLSPEARRIYLAAKRSAPAGALFTLVPEPFALDQLIQSPRPFKAVLYRGHFEQGGTPITGSFPVNVAQVVFAKHLIPNEARPATATYVVFGSFGDQFMAHLITGAPNFDQIFAVASSLPQTRAPISFVQFPGISDVAPPQAAALGSARPDIFTRITEVYEETDDLALP